MDENSVFIKKNHPPLWSSKKYGKTQINVWAHHKGEPVNVKVTISLYNPFTGKWANYADHLKNVKLAIAEFESYEKK